MKTIKVTYKVKSEYADTNKKNILQVMNDLKEINSPGIHYTTHVEKDGETFMHLGIFKDEKSLNILYDLQAFNKFRKELKDSKPEVAIDQQEIDLVGNSFNLFN